MRAQINFYLMLLAVLGLAPATTQARYLNPSTGRFQTMDSYEGNNQDPPSLQKYIDAGDDPVNKIDPSGHESIDEVLAVVNAGVFQSPKGAEASAGVRMKKILAPRRSLTQGEINLAKTVYGENIDYPKTGVEYGKWAFFQPDGREMTPDGFIHTGGQTISDYTTPGAKPNFPYPIIL